MRLTRRAALGAACAVTMLAGQTRAEDLRKAERALGRADAPIRVVEYFSLTCPHCAAFSLTVLPELRRRWIETGRVRWVFFDFPADVVAMQAAMLARHMPLEDYAGFLDRLFTRQEQWAYAQHPTEVLWQLCEASGMSRAEFDRSIEDIDLTQWILQQAADSQTRWHINATPSFLINNKVYEGNMPASDFDAILGA